MKKKRSEHRSATVTGGVGEPSGSYRVGGGGVGVTAFKATPKLGQDAAPCRSGRRSSPPQEVVLVRVFVKQLDLQMLPGVLVDQRLSQHRGGLSKRGTLKSA